jgi:putative PIN family toxin of toxin-antitoxin system
MGTTQPIVVFDSNVLIPLCIPASRSVRLLARLHTAGWAVAASPAILDEVAEKIRTKERLRRWLKLTDADIEEFVTILPSLLRIVPGAVQAKGVVTADPTDDKTIAAAIEAGASFIVSQDKHLRDLGSYGLAAIMSLEEFAAELDRQGIP